MEKQLGLIFLAIAATLFLMGYILNRDSNRIAALENKMK